MTIFVAVFSIYRYNFLSLAPNEIFQSFQIDSDSLVSTSVESCSHVDSSYGLFAPHSLDSQCRPYLSTLGIQGKTAIQAQKISIGVEGLKNIYAALLAAIMVTISMNIYRLSPLLSFTFFLFSVINPWTVLFARSTYWVSFIWWIPLLLGILYLKKKITAPTYFIGIGIVFLFKFLSGYEYASSIGMLAGIPFVLFYQLGRIEFKRQLLGLFQVALVLVTSFIVAFLIHSYIRGDFNLLVGIEKIIKEDVLRRTYGDVGNFDESTKGSLKVSTLSVIWMYLNHTPYMVPFFKLSRLPITFLAVLGFLVIRLKDNRKKNMWIIAYYLMTPLSWYILAKGHSHIHTHINYVLWSFSLGFLVYSAIQIYQANYSSPSSNAE